LYQQCLKALSVKTTWKAEAESARHHAERATHHVEVERQARKAAQRREEKERLEKERCLASLK